MNPSAHRRSGGVRLRDRLLDALEGLVGQSASRLLFLWLAVIVVFGLAYWLPTLFGARTLVGGGVPVTATLEGLGTALYFSFITGLSVGYGDVVPVGWWRVPAILEGAADLLLFGFVIARIMSRRQDRVLDELHDTAFEERLGRVRTNLHLALSEFEAIADARRAGRTPPAKLRARAESATLVLAGELRSVRGLLDHPGMPPEPALLAGLLATMAANLDGLRDLLDALGDEAAPSPILRAQVQDAARLAEQICGDCVPFEVGPAIRPWMDRVRERGRCLVA